MSACSSSLEGFKHQRMTVADFSIQSQTSVFSHFERMDSRLSCFHNRRTFSMMRKYLLWMRETLSRAELEQVSQQLLVADPLQDLFIQRHWSHICYKFSELGIS